MTIWMDGRPRPSKNAPHDQTGFTTGVWNGNELIATTTHLKTGYIRRNGAAEQRSGHDHHSFPASRQTC